MADISVEGIDEAVQRLGRAQAMAALRPPMVRSTARIVNFMGDYPAQRAGTKYRRTGTYGRRWTDEVTVSAEGIEGRVGNNTSYGPFVGSKQFQARWMRHWQTDEDAVDSLREPIIADFENVIQGVLNGEG